MATNNPTHRKKRALSRKPAASTPTRSGTGADNAERVRKQALHLLRGLSAPSEKAWPEARKLITRLVVESNEANVGVGDKVLFLLSCSLSIRHLAGYATLDSTHIKQIGTFVTNVQRYIDDLSQKRPLNFLMLAAPGAGKSHFIKCIAASLESHKVSAITFNMAGLQRNEDLIAPLDAARNRKVEDRVPLLFLDEFDSKDTNIALLLPLLWDGALNLGQRDLKLGKVIIVLAGSEPSLPSTMEQARLMRQGNSGELGKPKIVDLLSRINGGVVPIPPFFDPQLKIDRRFDKVCIAVQLLRNRFGSSLRQVPLSLLRFLARAKFRYGVRSLAHLIDLIPYRKNVTDLKTSNLKLPIGNYRDLEASSLAYHLLHDDQAQGVTKIWEEASLTKALLPISSEMVDNFQLEAYPPELLGFIFDRIVMELRH